MKKVKTKVIASLFVLIVFVITFSFPNIFTMVGYSDTAYSGQNESKIICSANATEEFSEESIIVVLNKKATYEFKNYTPKDFLEYNCVDITDLTQQTVELVKKQIKAEKTGNWDDLQTNIENSMLIDTENFRRILKLTIHQPVNNRNNGFQESNDSSINKINLLKTIKKIEKRSDILYCGPNYICESTAIFIEIPQLNEPNDLNSNQWAIKSIKLHNAWAITTGSNINVGVIDTGIDGTHNDLKNHLGNNLHRDFRLANEVVMNVPFDTSNHGTHVAGIIGAESNNKFGIAGTCWDVNLVSMIISEYGHWYVDNAILAVDFATSNNIKVLNYSGRVRDRNEVVSINDPAFEQAIRGYPGLFVVAAGNDGDNNDQISYFPSNYCINLNNVISVGALSRSDTCASFSNYGKNSVSIFAPGEEIYSTLPNGEFGYMSGTSMAAPYVTGVAALMLSENPNLTASQIKQTIMNTADKVDSLTDKCVSGGKLNAYKAVKSVHSEHSYNWASVYVDGKNHKSYCGCGKSILSAHWGYAGSGRYVKCEACGVTIDTWKYPILITNGINSIPLTSFNTFLISTNTQLVSYLDLTQAETVLSTDEMGEIISYYDEKFFAKYSILFGDINIDEFSYWLYKNVLNWQVE